MADGKRIPPETTCACGCGSPIPERRESGTIRYVYHDGPYFIHGHNPLGKGGPGHHLWKGGRILQRGHVLLYMPSDPRADIKGYVPEHRVVWERVNSRSLKPGEHVHHINGIPDDNRPENLVALTRRQHAQVHAGANLHDYYAALPPEEAHKKRSQAGQKGADALHGRNS